MGCRDAEKGREAEEALKKLGYDVEFRSLDVSDQGSIINFASEMERDYESINLLVNNAAIYLESKTIPLPQKAVSTITTNYFGTLWTTEALLPLLKKSNSPRIVNVSSELGHLSVVKSAGKREILASYDLTTEQLSSMMSTYLESVIKGSHLKEGWGCSPYSVSKVGVIAYTRILANMEPSVIVNTCSPGYCSTDMSDGKGIKTPEEGARTVFMTALIEDLSCRGKFFADENEIQW